MMHYGLPVLFNQLLLAWTTIYILLDWLADSGNNFLGHVIVITWPIKNVRTIRGVYFPKIQPTTICQIELTSNKNQAKTQWRSEGLKSHPHLWFYLQWVLYGNVFLDLRSLRMHGSYAGLSCMLWRYHCIWKDASYLVGKKSFIPNPGQIGTCYFFGTGLFGDNALPNNVGGKWISPYTMILKLVLSDWHTRWLLNVCQPNKEMLGNSMMM